MRLAATPYICRATGFSRSIFRSRMPCAWRSPLASRAVIAATFDNQVGFGEALFQSTCVSSDALRGPRGELRICAGRSAGKRFTDARRRIPDVEDAGGKNPQYTSRRGLLGDGGRAQVFGPRGQTQAHGE